MALASFPVPLGPGNEASMACKELFWCSQTPFGTGYGHVRRARSVHCMLMAYYLHIATSVNRYSVLFVGSYVAWTKSVFGCCVFSVTLSIIYHVYLDSWLSSENVSVDLALDSTLFMTMTSLVCRWMITCVKSTAL